MAGNLVEQLLVLEEEQVLADIRESLEKGEDPLALVEALREGMTLVGKSFEDKEYFLSELIMSAEIFKEAIALIEPHLGSDAGPSRGKVVVGTVKGDIHDIGKNIVATLLKGAGYEVNDLGTDVPTEKIVQIIKEDNPNYLGLSALLTTTMLEMGVVIKALEENNLRDKVKVLIGGAAVSDEYAEEIGADAFCIDGFDAIRKLETF
jgi:corrinoid protein of di/trimethylamine methyltransferase